LQFSTLEKREREKLQVFVMLQGDQVNSQASVNSHASVPLSQVGEENNYLRELCYQSG